MQEDKKIELDRLFIMSVIFIFFYFGSSHITDSKIIEYLLTGFGGVLAYFVSISLPKSKLRKIAISVAVAVGVIAIFIYYARPSPTANEKKQDLLGEWQSDDSDEIILTFKISEDRILVAKSPDYVETEYSSNLKGDSLLLYKDGEVRFRWTLIHIDSNHVQIEDGSERLMLKRMISSFR